MSEQSITVRVPATSANLGPGFDCLGIALDLFNTFTVILDRPFHIEVTGESALRLPRDTDNAVYQAMQKVFQRVNVPSRLIPTFALRMENQIAVSSGLGSSASAIVGGLLLGNEMIRHVARDHALSLDDILEMAVDIEGHPDNVAPALYGGGILSFHNRAGALQTTQVPIPSQLYFVAATPDFALSTEVARQVLPSTYSRAHVVENMAQCSRLILALATQDLNLIRGGLVDYIHEPYRLPLVPGAEDVRSAAIEAGALAVTLSGAGPTLLAWCRKERAVEIADEMTLAWLNAGTPCKAMVLAPAVGETKPVLGG